MIIITLLQRKEKNGSLRRRIPGASKSMVFLQLISLPAPVVKKEKQGARERATCVVNPGPAAGGERWAFGVELERIRFWP